MVPEVLLCFDVFFFFYLSYRFPDIFVDVETVCQMQHRLEGIIGEAVSSPNKLKAVAEKRPHRRTRFKSNIKWLKQYKFLLTW